MKTNCECPQCGEVFFSRKLRHQHQVLRHWRIRVIGTHRTMMKNNRLRIKREADIKLSAEQLISEAGYVHDVPETFSNAG